jgi:dTMP kinase
MFFGDEGLDADVNPYPGTLIAVEGIDGSGKSTQLRLLQRHLENEGHQVTFTEWNSSELVEDTMDRAKDRDELLPSTFSLLHAVDFAQRYAYRILPALEAGLVVLADRYVFTAFGRDGARGVDVPWVENLYRFAVPPDLGLYFDVPVDVAVERLMSGDATIGYHEAGMDLGLALDPVESFRRFQGRVLDRYDEVASEYGLHRIDATDPIDDQQEEVRHLAHKVIGERLSQGASP